MEMQTIFLLQNAVFLNTPLTFTKCFCYTIAVGPDYKEVLTLCLVLRSFLGSFCDDHNRHDRSYDEATDGQTEGHVAKATGTLHIPGCSRILSDQGDDECNSSAHPTTAPEDTAGQHEVPQERRLALATPHDRPIDQNELLRLAVARLRIRRQEHLLRLIRWTGCVRIRSGGVRGFVRFVAYGLTVIRWGC